MNILYQKAKLLGRPFRNDDDDSSSSSTDSGGYDSATTWSNVLNALNNWGSSGDSGESILNAQEREAINAALGGATPADFLTLLASSGDTGGESLSTYIDSGAASAEEAAAITKAFADAKISDLTKIPKGVWDTLKGIFKTEAGGTDWTKLGMAGGALLSATGLGKAEVGGYKGKVPELTAVRERVNYDDPNRRPGAGGRDYFTDTRYVSAKDTAALDAAKAAAKEEAAGILAGYKPATAATATKSIFKTPWEKAAATTGATTGTTAATLPAVPNALDIAKDTYPEKFAENLPAWDTIQNPTIADAIKYLKVGDTESGNAIMKKIVETKPAAAPPPSNMAPGTYLNPGTGKLTVVPAPAATTGGITDVVTPAPAPAPTTGGIVDAVAPATTGGGFFRRRLAARNAAPTTLAEGGPAMREPRYLRGITDGMEDKIKTSIDNKQPALLSHGEFVIPADVVSHLGNGNSDAGAKKLYQMMDRVRQARTGNKKQGKQINPDKFMPGGQVAYDQGGIVAFEEGGSAGTTKASNLSEWVGDYTTQAIGEAQAAAAKPYEAYKGPLTAGASDLQTNAFAGIKGLAETGYTPGTFTAGTFDAAAANKYMNPYISQALDPQLKELRRQAQISNLGTLAKAGRAGIASGASRDLMESEGIRNLLSKQADVLGTGYASAYDKAMQQFNAEQNRGLDVQKAEEESRKTSADYSRNILNDMAKLGQTQRDIEAEGIAADLKEFETQRDYDLKMPQYKIGLLQKLPVETQTNETAQNALIEALQSGGTLTTLLKSMGLIK